jgi:hypothetical protein
MVDSVEFIMLVFLKGPTPGPSKEGSFSGETESAGA